jgi:hypothetical protein
MILVALGLIPGSLLAGRRPEECEEDLTHAGQFLTFSYRQR